MKKGWIVLLVHLVIVLSVAGKAEYEKRTLPREWLRTAPYDPNRPLRGRYVLMMAERKGQQERLEFYIPDGVPDPSIRPRGEELWVEVLVASNENLRPVRLGVKKDGVLTPLPLR